MKKTQVKAVIFLRRMRIFSLTILCLLVLVASCKNSGGDAANEEENSGGSTSTELPVCTGVSASQKSIQGTAQYQLPTFNAATGLNLGAPTISTKPIRQAYVQITKSDGSCTLGTGNTNNAGAFNITYNSEGISNIKIRVTASIRANTINANFSATTNTLVSVIDNTNSGALYALVKNEVVATTNTGTVTAPVTNSGSGPFAILDIALDAYNLIKNAEAAVQFTTLPINWSVNNVPVSGNLAAGQIGTSFWNGSALYILGQANVDADEFDLPVVGHEFGHYVESTLFRSDSIGGSHTGSNKLDPRVAFGEGFGNAFGSIVRNSSIYYDTSGTNMTTIAVGLDLEDNNFSGAGNVATTNAGGFNETSVQRILWDIFDTNADAGDTINGVNGFQPIFQAFRNGQKTSTALTTIVSFTSSLTATSLTAADISSIVNQEVGGGADVNGMDHFGSGGTVGGMSNNEGTCRTAMYHTDLTGNTHGPTTGDSINFTTPTGGSGFNKYCSTKWYKYSPATSASRTISISGLTAGCDLDIYLYSQGNTVGSANQGGEGASEAFTASVTGGSVYVFEVRGYSRAGSSLNSASGGPCNFSYSIN